MTPENFYALFIITKTLIGFGMLVFSGLSAGPGKYDRSTFYLLGGLFLMGVFE